MAEDGVTEALHIAQSDGLSPTIDNANKAIELVKEKYGARAFALADELCK